jgi:hypothetical protein
MQIERPGTSVEGIRNVYGVYTTPLLAASADSSLKNWQIVSCRLIDSRKTQTNAVMTKRS